jgi:hypothetical protein
MGQLVYRYITEVRKGVAAERRSLETEQKEVESLRSKLASVGGGVHSC